MTILRLLVACVVGDLFAGIFVAPLIDRLFTGGTMSESSYNVLNDVSVLAMIALLFIAFQYAAMRGERQRDAKSTVP